MVRILFVCHGNICRSQMAACILRDMIARQGEEITCFINSAATSREEIGNPMYLLARRKLEEMGVAIDNHKAVQMTCQDYASYDLLLGMDSANLRNMKTIAGGDLEGKICRLLDFSARPRDIADPWYTGNFDQAYDDIVEGCQALLSVLRKGFR